MVSRRSSLDAANKMINVITRDTTPSARAAPQLKNNSILEVTGQQHLQGLLDIVPADTGLHTIGLLPSNIQEEDVAAAALKRDIVVTPIGRYCIRPAEIAAGVDALAEILNSLDR
jgi:DNA-binding transcriptional MocR family regulator